MPSSRPGHFVRFLDLRRLERRVLECLANDMRMQEVGPHLEIAIATVRSHTKNARKRNRIRTTTGLVARLVAESARIPPKPAPRSEWLRR